MYFNEISIIAILTLAFSLELVLQKMWIAKMRSLKIKQVTKLYGPSWHEKTKTGTPTMGGVVFVLVLFISMLSAAALLEWVDMGNVLLVTSYPLLASAIGFADDWIKHKRDSADGLSSMQKFVMQVAVTLFWILWIAPEGTANVSLLGFMEFNPLPSWVGILLLTFAGVGLQNAVNVTDGLDGLAVGCAIISITITCILFAFLGGTLEIVLMLLVSFFICAAFLWHNAHPASVFMGDVGAHFIAGVLFTAFALSGNFLLIVPSSFMFGMEMLSVVIQIIAIRGFKKKVFRMSPMHHHFEMLGWSETQIVTRFYIVHFLGFLLTMITMMVILWLNYVI